MGGDIRPKNEQGKVVRRLFVKYSGQERRLSCTDGGCGGGEKQVGARHDHRLENFLGSRCQLWYKSQLLGLGLKSVVGSTTIYQVEKKTVIVQI